MNNWKDDLDRVLPEIESYISKLMDSEKVLFREASPPKEPGTYIVYDHENNLSYIGEAKGSGGLKDRLISKHLSGDDNHAIQRAYKWSHPDRGLRREYIKNNVSVRWVATRDANTALAVERLLILMFNPPWNRK